jgi:6-phosphofructo-2-kinase
MINVGKKLVAHNIQGFLAGQAIFFLLNFNLAERQIWITRHGMTINDPDSRSGESTDNLLHKLGGSSSLKGWIDVRCKSY